MNICQCRGILLNMVAGIDLFKDNDSGIIPGWAGVYMTMKSVEV